MNKKFELLREAVNTYKVNHCDGNKNEKPLLEFIDELEQLTIPVVIVPRGTYCECKLPHCTTKTVYTCVECNKPQNC